MKVRCNAFVRGGVWIHTYTRREHGESCHALDYKVVGLKLAAESEERTSWLIRWHQRDGKVVSLPIRQDVQNVALRQPADLRAHEQLMHMIFQRLWIGRRLDI